MALQAGSVQESSGLLLISKVRSEDIEHSPGKGSPEKWFELRSNENSGKGATETQGGISDVKLFL